MQQFFKAFRIGNLLQMLHYLARNQS